MRTTLRTAVRRAAMAALAACVLGGPASCAKDHGLSLLILDAIAMTQQMQCTVRAEMGSQYLRPFGVLDLCVSNTYWLFPRYLNQMPSITELTGEGPESLQGEVNTLSIVGATVLADFGPLVAGATGTQARVLDKYSLDGQHVYLAGSVETGQEGTTAVQLIPPDLGNVLYELVLKYTKTVKNPSFWITVYVTIDALTADRYRIHSNRFSFPIELCLGCLVRVVTNDPTVKIQSNAVPCLPGQDDAVDNNLFPFVAIHQDGVCNLGLKTVP